MESKNFFRYFFMDLDCRSTIRKQDIQFGIDKRNKAFGDIVGVPKVSTEV